MKCQEFRCEIEELSPDERLSRAALAHASTCAACALVQREQLALKRLVETLEPVAAPTDFDFKLAARLSAVRASRAQPIPIWRFASGTVSVALASIFVITVCAALLFKELPFGHPPSVTQTNVASANSSNNAIPPPANMPIFKPAVNGDVVSTFDTASNETTASRKLIKVKRKSSVAQPSREDYDIARAAETLVNPTLPLKAVNFSSSAAAIVTRPTNDAAERYGIISLPLTAAPETTQVLLKDKCGAQRFVNLPRVTFGAHDALQTINADCRADHTAQNVW